MSAEDLARHFKSVPKGQQTVRLQQIESLLQTLQELGLLRRTEGDVCEVSYVSCAIKGLFP